MGFHYPSIRKRGHKNVYTVTYRGMTFYCNGIARAIYLRGFLMTKNNINLPG
jgi:hypothetical protein